MTREEFAEKIHWSKLFWLVGMMNPLFMVPQLYTIWAAGTCAGISLTTLGILIFLQIGFGLHSFFMRDTPLIVSNGASLSVTVSTIGSILYFS